MMEPLNRARKVMGWGNAGVVVSPTNALNTLTQMNRTFGEKQMPAARNVLREMVAGKLPQQSLCVAGFKEVEAAREVVKQILQNDLRESESEEDAPRPGL